MMRVIVTGPRDYFDRQAMHAKLTEILGDAIERGDGLTVMDRAAPLEHAFQNQANADWIAKGLGRGKRREKRTLPRGLGSPRQGRRTDPGRRDDPDSNARPLFSGRKPPAITLQHLIDGCSKSDRINRRLVKINRAK